MCHTEQMGERERAKREKRGCVRKCFSFCIYPWRSGSGKRVECSLLLFSSIRLSRGGKHGAHPPVDYSSDTAKPPYSHVQAALKHMYSLWETLNAPNTQTQTEENIFLSTPPSSTSSFSLSGCPSFKCHYMPKNIMTHICHHTHTHILYMQIYTHMCLQYACMHAQRHKTTLTCSHTWLSALFVTHTHIFRYSKSQGSGRIFSAASVWHKQIFLLYKMGYRDDEPCWKKARVALCVFPCPYTCVCACVWSCVWLLLSVLATYCTCLFLHELAREISCSYVFSFTVAARECVWTLWNCVTVTQSDDAVFQQYPCRIVVAI